MSSLSPVSHVTPQHEVDIFILFQSIWQDKCFVSVLGALFALAAFVYTCLVTSVYQVESVLRPTVVNEMDALNRSGVYALLPQDALLKVAAAMESYSVRLGFFRANQAMFSYLNRPGVTLEQSFESFNKSALKVVTNVSDKVGSLNSHIRLELNYPAGVEGARILNGFVEYVIKSERDQIEADLKIMIQNRHLELESSIDAARAEYDIGKQARIAALVEADDVKRSVLKDELVAQRKQLKIARMDRVAQLSESIDIAHTLGIQKPTTPSGLAGAQRTGDSRVVHTEINNQQVPLYFMGFETLEAERAALLKRQTDDFTGGRIAQIASEMLMLEKNREVEVLNQRQNEELFLSGVQPLRAEIVRLNKLNNLDLSNIRLVAIDRIALEPLEHISPKKILLVLSGGLLGCAVGVLIVLTRSLSLTRRYGS